MISERDPGFSTELAARERLVPSGRGTVSGHKSMRRLYFYHIDGGQRDKDEFLKSSSTASFVAAVSHCKEQFGNEQCAFSTLYLTFCLAILFLKDTYSL